MKTTYEFENGFAVTVEEEDGKVSVTATDVDGKEVNGFQTSTLPKKDGLEAKLESLLKIEEKLKENYGAFKKITNYTECFVYDVYDFAYEVAVKLSDSKISELLGIDIDDISIATEEEEGFLYDVVKALEESISVNEGCYIKLPKIGNVYFTEVYDDTKVYVCLLGTELSENAKKIAGKYIIKYFTHLEQFQEIREFETYKKEKEFADKIIIYYRDSSGHPYLMWMLK